MKTAYTLFLAVLTATSSSVWASPKVINGVDAGEGEFPYYVEMSIQTESFPDHPNLCGGSLIAPDVVLSAASCFPHDIISAHAKITDNEGNKINRTCKTWLTHPEFSDSFLLNDIVLCKLNETVTIDESYVTVELDSDESFAAPGTELIAFGMGVKDNFENLPDVLQNVTLTAASTDICNEQKFKAIMESVVFELGQTDPDDKKEILDQWSYVLDVISQKDELYDPKVQLCTIYNVEEDLTTCFDDSGGPIVKRIYQGNGSFVDIQVGVTSTGLNLPLSEKICGYPTFVRISGVIDWITSTACDTMNSVGSMCKNNTKAPKKTKAPKRTKAPKNTKAPKK